MQAPLAQIVMRMLRPMPQIADPSAARGHITTFSPRQLATTVWGLCRLELHSGPLYDAAATPLMQHMRGASDKALSMVSSTYSRAPVQDRSRMALAVLRSVLASLRARILSGSCIPDVIADTAWHAWCGCRAQPLPQVGSPRGPSRVLTIGDSTPSMASTASTGTSQPDPPDPAQAAQWDRAVATCRGDGEVAARSSEQAASVTNTDLPAVRQALTAAVSSLGECRPQVPILLHLSSLWNVPHAYTKGTSSEPNCSTTCFEAVAPMV